METTRTDRKGRQKTVDKDLNNINSDLTDVYRILRRGENTFFPNTFISNKIFTKVDHTVAHKENLNRLLKMETSPWFLEFWLVGSSGAAYRVCMAPLLGQWDGGQVGRLKKSKGFSQSMFVKYTGEASNQ